MIRINQLYNKNIEAASTNTNVDRRTTEKVVNIFLKNTANDIIAGNTVTIPYLGSFKVRTTKQRRIKDINTGEYRMIQQRNNIKYTPKKWIINQINE